MCHLHRDIRLTLPFVLDVKNSVSRECVARGMSVCVCICTYKCERNRKNKTLKGHNGCLAERKTPRIHFPALSALSKSKCVQLLCEDSTAFPACSFAEV